VLVDWVSTLPCAVNGHLLVLVGGHRNSWLVPTKVLVVVVAVLAAGGEDVVGDLDRLSGALSFGGIAFARV